MRISYITPVYVDVIPEVLDNGKLYICERYKIVVHRCCCGCSEEVVTPLSPADWSLRRHGDRVSLSPSIGNWKFPCRSHYWIQKNKIVWARTMTQTKIKRIQKRDALDKQRYIAAINRQKDRRTKLVTIITQAWRLLLRLWKR